MDYDQALEVIGEFGKYQRIKYLLLCLIAIPCAFNNLGYVFWAARPDHWCAPPLHLAPLLDNLTQEQWKDIGLPRNEDGSFSECSMYAHNYSSMTSDDLSLLLDGAGSNASFGTPIQSCDMWQYDTSQYISTIVTDFDLVCQRKWFKSTSQSVFMVGRIIGTVFTGHMADRFGRRPVLLCSILLAVLLSVLCTFTPEIYTFFVCRFLLAIADTGMFQTTFVIVMELVGQSWRVFAGTILMEFWALGYILMAGLAYLIRDRFTLQLVTSIPFFIFMLYYWLIPESPRWLIAKGRTDEANKIINKMADYNGAKLPDDVQLKISGTKATECTFRELIRKTVIFQMLVILFYIWFTNSIVYYGLSLNSSNLAGNDYVNFAVAGAVEIPAYAATIVALLWLGRRWPICIAMCLAGAALFSTLTVPDDLQIVSTCLAMVGKFAITGSYSMIYVYSAELLPTPLRTFGIGWCSMISRIGGVIAPYAVEVGEWYSGLPLIIFGIMSLIGGFLVLLLPETKNKELPETIEDGEKLARDAYICSKCSGSPHDRDEHKSVDEHVGFLPQSGVMPQNKEESMSLKDKCPSYES